MQEADPVLYNSFYRWSEDYPDAFRLILSKLCELKILHVRSFKYIRQFYFIWHSILIGIQANVLSEGGSCMSLGISMSFFYFALDWRQQASSKV